MATRASTLEPADEAARYLAEGRLIVHEVSPFRVRATVRADGHIYECGYFNKTWFCGCPDRERCAHLVALQLVVAR